MTRPPHGHARAAVLARLSRGGEWTPAEMAEATGLSQDGARSILRALAGSGHAARREPTDRELGVRYHSRDRLYRIAEAGKAAAAESQTEKGA